MQLFAAIVGLGHALIATPLSLVFLSKNTVFTAVIVAGGVLNLQGVIYGLCVVLFVLIVGHYGNTLSKVNATQVALITGAQTGAIAINFALH